jgi:N-acetyl sugar amidotransferase
VDARKLENGAATREPPVPSAGPPFRPETLRVCTKTVMDNTDPDIFFDADGVCNWWHEFHRLRASQPSADEKKELLAQVLTEIKEVGRGREYDSILGLSGGVDSSYLAVLAKQWGLRPLVLHFDNGWNDELAVRNIEVIVRKLDYRLQTFVMDWPEFRDLQRAYFKASVLDLEVPTDHMIFGALYKIANERGIRYLLSGNNFATEWLLPRAWYYSKGDAANLSMIHKRFGDIKRKNLPTLNGWRRLYLERMRGLRQVQGLDLIDYRKTDAKALLMDQFGWRDYGGKHYESVFTRFYQGYVLPVKYGIDKRKAHLSNLILNGEITRDEALAELKRPTYDPDQQRADKRYVAKKLGWTADEFERILALPPVAHEVYGTDATQRRAIETVRGYLRPLVRLSAMLRGA